MHNLFPVTFILMLVCCPVGLVLHAVFLSQLRSRHMQTWEVLGRPTLLLNNSIANCFAVQRFLWRREYRDLGDVPFARFASFLLYYQIAYIILFAVFLVAGIWINK
jgi:hypothetical protein